MDSGLIKLEGLFVIPHDNLDLPSPRIREIDVLRGPVEVAFENHGPEGIPSFPIVGAVVTAALVRPPEVVCLLLCRLSRFAESIEPFAPAGGRRLLELYPRMAFEDPIE